MGTAGNQGELWSKIPHDWAKLQEPMHAPLWEAMFDSGAVCSGTHFLDAGCGGGGASMMAAERGASVSGIDAAEGLIKFAHERLPSGDFRVGDIESLPYEDEIFDTVFAASSVQYSGNRIATLREFGRVCKPTGSIVVGLFGPPEKVKFSSIFKAMRDAMPEPPKGGGPFELSGDGILEGLFTEAGLRVIGGNEIDCPFKYTDFEMFYRANVSAGPMQGMLQSISEVKLKTILRNAVEQFCLPSGEIIIQPNIFKYIVATRY